MRPSMLFLLLPLFGCAASTGLDRDAVALAEELEGRIGGQPQACVPVRAGEGLTIGDRRTILYRAADTVWVNRLDRECPGFEPLSTLIVQVHGSQYCRGDQVRAREPGANIPGPVCILRDFVPYRRASALPSKTRSP